MLACGQRRDLDAGSSRFEGDAKVGKDRVCDFDERCGRYRMARLDRDGEDKPRKPGLQQRGGRATGCSTDLGVAVSAKN